MDSFSIKYEHGKMVVTHLSGVIQEITVEALNKVKDLIVTEKNSNDDMIESLDNYIFKVQESANNI